MISQQCPKTHDFIDQNNFPRAEAAGGGLHVWKDHSALSDAAGGDQAGAWPASWVVGRKLNKG